MKGKILTLETLVAQLAQERRGGRTVVLANGCFDLLHVGHLRYLEGAKRLGDILVVGVNSDRSVGELKGRGRPLLCEETRAMLVGSFSCVDYVFLFDDLTLERTIRHLRPDVHCKGTDYDPHRVPERETVRSLGGRVAITGDPKTHSTRDLIKRILRVPCPPS